MIPRLIVVDRENFTLDIYRWRTFKQRYDTQHRYMVTVGKEGNETPHGLYFVERKTREADWRIPEDPDYSEESWGSIVPHGAPGNPFKSGFISLGGDVSGIGIHDTTFEPRVGTASSHGCIRMRTEDFLEIYDRCKIGTPVYLH
jgi:lipoprotein-anchoring transpeptidase ErfK/SrfK